MTARLLTIDGREVAGARLLPPAAQREIKTSALQRSTSFPFFGAFEMPSCVYILRPLYQRC